MATYINYTQFASAVFNFINLGLQVYFCVHIKGYIPVYNELPVANFLTQFKSQKCYFFEFIQGYSSCSNLLNFIGFVTKQTPCLMPIAYQICHIFLQRKKIIFNNYFFSIFFFYRDILFFVSKNILVQFSIVIFSVSFFFLFMKNMIEEVEI